MRFIPDGRRMNSLLNVSELSCRRVGEHPQSGLCCEIAQVFNVRLGISENMLQAYVHVIYLRFQQSAEPSLHDKERSGSTYYCTIIIEFHSRSQSEPQDCPGPDWPVKLYFECSPSPASVQYCARQLFGLCILTNPHNVVSILCTVLVADTTLPPDFIDHM